MRPSFPPILDDTPRIGPFALFDVIGAAGMGVVWRGMHVEQNIPVAIKFLTAEGSRDPLYLGCLKNEVRKAAALDHPAIVRVHDHGEVPDSIGVDSLIPGSPYLVMEYAEGGTLSRHCGTLDWAQTYRVLMRLLASLAHAHSHGVIHRDLKPGNVLLRRATGGVMLTDFGLARAGDTDGGPVLNAGTPSYMAPEQIAQISADIGPWTDMYALGCLAWSLLCGPPPFHRSSVEEVLEAHLSEPVPEFEPRKPVPNGVEAWIQQLLHKSPRHRYVRAADAMHALLPMAPSDTIDTLHTEPVFKTPSPTMGLRVGPTEATSKADDTQVMAPRTISGPQSAPAPMPQIEQSLLWAQRVEVPPMPEEWRTDRPYRAVPHLLGTGLAMFGMRSLPIVGREAEQQLLWNTLATVRENACTRIVVVEGAGGTGKSHLAEWIARRSYEVGASIPVRAEFEANQLGDPLVNLVHSLLGTTGLNRTEAKARVEIALTTLGSFDPQEIETLLLVLGPFADETVTEAMQEDRDQFRLPVIRRILHRFSVLRPIVVVLDDAHRNQDAFEFAKLLMAASPIDHPILVVMCVNGIAIEAEGAQHLKALKKRKNVQTLPLGPLATEHRSTLVRRLLGLEPKLAALVERRCGGNPQFAVQLVGDWIQKDMLTHSAEGFTLRPGVRAEFPADLQAVWERRLSAALPESGDPQCLQVAADLGISVSQAEWIETCALLGIEASKSMMNALVDANLLVPQANRRGWTFVHSLVQETLKRHAEFAGHRVAHHSAIAAMLAGREAAAVRRGRHLYLAGELAESIDVLLAGAALCIGSSRGEVAWDLLTLREQALEEIGVPKTDLRWSEGWMLKVRFYHRRTMYAPAIELLERILRQTANTQQAERTRGTAFFLRGLIYRQRSKPAEARESLQRAMDAAPEEITVQWRVLQEMGLIELEYGDLDLSEEYFKRALEAAAQTGKEADVYTVRYLMAGVYRRNGDTESSHRHLSAALEYHRRTGSKRAESDCLNNMAELDRFAGRLKEAEEGYRLSLAIRDAVGDKSSYISVLNLGSIYAETGRPVEARNQLEQLIRLLDANGLDGHKGAAHLFLAQAYVQLDLMHEWRQSFTEGVKLVTETGIVDVDIARSAMLGGDELLAHNYPEEAAESLEFSLSHWKLLKREVEVEAVSKALAAITGPRG